MRTIDLRRHTDNDGDQLSEQGIAAARALVGRLSPPYDAFVSTGANRATQTVEIWRTAVGGRSPVRVEPGLRSQREDHWRAAARQAGSAELDRMREVNPELVQQDSTTLGAALRRVLDALPEGGRALVCGHSPTNEAAVLGLTGNIVDPIGKGAGVRVTELGDGTYRVETLP